MSEDLVIIGTGGHGTETLDIVEAINEREPTWRFNGFLDDDPAMIGVLKGRNTVCLGTTEVLRDHNARYVIGIGSSDVRERIDQRLSSWGRTAATLIHPQATVAANNWFDDGVVLAAGARVTSGVRLGRHVQLNVNAVVSHGCSIGDYTTLSPGSLVNGDVTIGEKVLLGTGAIVMRGCTIGDGAIIGAGAVVICDIPPGVTVIGVPGRWKPDLASEEFDIAEAEMPRFDALGRLAF